MATKSRKPVASSKAKALLDAHVKFTLADLQGAPLRALIERELDAALALAGQLKLKDVVDRKSVKESIQAYAVELKLQGGIPELVGNIARTLYEHPALKKATLGSLLSDKVFAEMLGKALEMKELRAWLIHTACASPPFLAVASELIHQGIKGYLAENPLTRNIPGAKSMLKLGKAVMSKAAPGLDESIDENLGRYIRHSVKTSAKAAERFASRSLESPGTHKAVLAIWERLKPLKLGELREATGVTPLDVEEVFVILYQYWHELRRTELYSALINAGVDQFFDQYEDSSLSELIDDIGITRDMMLAEALRYTPKVIERLQRQQLLEPIVRRNLERFYRSDAAAALLMD